MAASGLLILTQPLSHVRRNLPLYLTELDKLLTKTAYIHLQPDSFNKVSSQTVAFNIVNTPFTIDIRNIVKDLYVHSNQFCSSLDIRVLLSHYTNTDQPYKKYHFTNPCDIVFIDRELRAQDEELFLQSVRGLFDVRASATCQVLHGEQDDNVTNQSTDSTQTIKQHNHTILGGTFDRLHVGHKILLSEGCMLGTQKLTVGVTDGDCNNKKTLKELIQPVEERITVVEGFLMDVKPTMTYSVVPIFDMYGPTVTEENIDLIVLSNETRKGGEMVNEQRQKMGMRKLEEYTIDLVEDGCHSEYEENKVSSSSLRKRLLGTLYNPIKGKSWQTGSPYIIGFTGGIASGKSSVCKRLEKLGAAIIDCDKLGHQAYIKGSQGFDKLVTEFGDTIVGENGEIDRRELGKIVFGNKDALAKLNDLIWPEIATSVQHKINDIKTGGYNVVILDAAVLLEAGWDTMCHEVWCTIVPENEAIKRIVERNQLSEDQAKLRLNSQISNQERVVKSNVILCTLWEYEYTQQQVEKAWELLQKRLVS